MNYTLDDLIELVSRHDENEDFYRAKLQELLNEERAKAWDEGMAEGWNYAARAAILGEHVEAPENPYRGE